jgi:dihydrofolate reductase
MARLTTFTFLTLDGVMQAPGMPDEDTRGGFEHGGWAGRYNDEVMAGVMGEGMAREGALLFGRRTYENFYAVWPNQPQPNPFTDVLNRTQKYVASRTLSEPLPWENSTLLSGDAAKAVTELKRTADKEITVLGSGDLLQSLMREDLVDEYTLLIHPLVLGKGRRLFEQGLPSAELELLDTTITTTGVIIGRYQPASGRS